MGIIVLSSSHPSSVSLGAIVPAKKKKKKTSLSFLVNRLTKLHQALPVFQKVGIRTG